MHLFRPPLSSCNSIKFTDDLTEPPNVHEDLDYPAQDQEGNENLTSEGHYQVTTEQQTDVPGPAVHAIDRSGEGESSNDVEPEQAQPADDEESTVGPLSGDECTELPVGVVESNRAQGTAVVTDSDNGHPGPAEDLDAAAAHDHPDHRNTPLLGENSTEYEEVVTPNEDYEADYNENDQDSEHGEPVAIEGYARDADWETTASDTQHTQYDQEQHEYDAAGTDKCGQTVRILSTDDLTPLSIDSETIDLTAPNPDHDHITGQQGGWLPHCHTDVV